VRNLPFLLLFSLLSCARREILEISASPESLFQKGIEYLNQGRYKEAEKSFSEIIYHYSGSGYWEDAQFFLAETYFKKGDYYRAKDEFFFFIKNFPASKYYEEASYKYAISFLSSLPKINREQGEISELEDFVLNFNERYENSPYRSQMDSILLAIADRKAKKELQNGLLYYKAGEWQSARVYFEYITKEFPNTQTALEAKFFLAEIFWHNGEREKAREIFEELLQKPIRKGVREKISKYLSER